MKNPAKGIVFSLALLPMIANADSVLTDKKVKYNGDSTAISVCKSVVADDSEKLQQLLRRYRRTLTYSYQLDLLGDNVAGAFSCNDLALVPFADEIGAQNVSSYLRGGTVTVEELVSVTD